MATININVDEQVKEKSKEILEYLGTDFTNVINMLLKQIILTESIPFEVKVPRSDIETIKTIKDTAKGAKLSKEYKDIEDMWND